MKQFHYTQPFAVVGAFIVRDGKILLIKENHYPDVGKWNLPAGKLDLGESPADGSIREAFEESGLVFTPRAILGIHSVSRQDLEEELHPLRIVYMGDATGEVSLENGDPEDGVEEITDYRWLTPEEILAMNNSDLRYHDIKLFVQKWQQNITYPLSLIEHIFQR